MLETEELLTSRELAEELRATLDVDDVSVFPDEAGRARVNLVENGAVRCAFEVEFNVPGRPRAEEIESARRLAHEELEATRPGDFDDGFAV